MNKASLDPMRDLTLRFFLFLNLLALLACSEPAPSTKEQSLAATKQEPAPTEVQKTALLEHFQEDSVLTWQETLDTARELQKQVNIFLSKPGKASLEASLVAWEQSHTQYLASKFYRQLGLAPLHTLLDLETPALHSFDVRIDQQPLILGYLDSVAGYPQSGLIYSEMKIDEKTLSNEHQLGDPAYVALGFHALKDLLEGDHSLKQTPEDRFSPDKAKSDKYIERRRTLLSVLNQVLANDIERITQAWLSPQGHYSQEITQMGEDELFTRIRQAISREKGELATLAQAPDTHLNADALILRENRITRFSPLL